MSGAAGGNAALLFPGQGSQKVGMGRAWADASPAARAVFAAADEVLDLPLSALCWEGPADLLQLTVNTQPAILTTSLAALRGLEEAGWLARLAPVALAGHSLGEYGALVAAGSLAFADALWLVRRRGEFMQEAVPMGEGAMAAIVGLAPESVAAAAAAAAATTSGVCSIANYNSPEQTVLAGHLAAVEQAIAYARARGARRAVLLPVSAPFHSPLMAPARAALAPLLAATRFADPAPPVVTNIDARPVATGTGARDALVRQVDGPVSWVASIRWMAEEMGVDLFVEVGPGAVLAGLVRRIVPAAAVVSLAEPAGLAELQRLAG